MIEINRYTLDNGLRIVHSQDRNTQMVALNLLYDVGARDEHPEHTGFAHLFEHLMFGGSVNISDYDNPLQLAGGENNAWTSNDITNYYLSIPAQNVETGFWLESDRMSGLAFTPHNLETQKQVVSEEFKERYLNQPYGDIGNLMRELAFRVHPYQWATIGRDLSHIAQATMAEVKNFFYRFYVPNNAILAVTGNISAEETFRLSQKWFGDIPYRSVPLRQLPQEPQQTSERRMRVERNVPTDVFYMTFHMPGRAHPDYHTYDLLSDVLSNGRSSRLTSRLLKEQRLFDSIDAYVSGTFEPGLFHIMGNLSKGIPPEQAEDAVWQELDSLRKESVSDRELEKVKNKFESTQLFNNLNYLDLAARLACFELLGCAEDINDEVYKYRAVSADDLRRVAQQTFVRNNCNILYYMAKR